LAIPPAGPPRCPARPLSGGLRPLEPRTSAIFVGKNLHLENLPGSETGPGQVGTQGKATEDNVNAFAFKWDRAGNSSKHITFDWSGPDPA
jgi:hypothetical protein